MKQSSLIDIFNDERLVEKIKDRLPYLFQLTELEASRAGRVGMEIGLLRERIIIALLIYKFGEDNVNTNIPITEPEVDVRVFSQPVSIKTITGIGSIKVAWTVDAQSEKRFVQSYTPRSEMLLIQINWSRLGKFFYIPLYAQHEIFERMGKERYLKLPKPGTDPRGVRSLERLYLLLLAMRRPDTLIYIGRGRLWLCLTTKRWVDYWL